MLILPPHVRVNIPACLEMLTPLGCFQDITQKFLVWVHLGNTQSRLRKMLLFLFGASEDKRVVSKPCSLCGLRWDPCQSLSHKKYVGSSGPGRSILHEPWDRDME